MKCKLHIGLLALVLPGLLVLAGCERVPDPDDSGLVTQGPVGVSLVVSLDGYDDRAGLTKADFVDVDAAIHYAHEKQISDVGFLLFDASADDAFTSTGVLDPVKAVFVGAATPVHIDSLGAGRYRLEFSLPDTYKAVAVVTLVNFEASTQGFAGYDALAAAGASLATVVANLSAASGAPSPKYATYQPDQSVYYNKGIPMHGWQVYGSKDHPLRFYTGMSTPLTREGFSSAAALNAYAAKGTVADEDVLPLGYALARLHLRYEPATGQPSKDDVTLKSVKLHGYKDQIRILPPGFVDPTKPGEKPGEKVTPFDAVTGVGNWAKTGGNAMEVSFHHLNAAGHDQSMVAYVPEMDKDDMDTLKDSDSKPDRPALKAKVSWKQNAKISYTYEYWRDWIKVTRTVTEGGTSTEGTPRTYTGLDPKWRDWTGFVTVSKKNDKAGVEKPSGTPYNVVRHYSYEWIATGFEGLPTD